MRSRLKSLGRKVKTWYRGLDEDAVSVVLAALVGIFTALVGIVFELAIHAGSELSGLTAIQAGESIPFWWILGLPVAGGLAVGLLRRLLDAEGVGFGVGHVLQAIASTDGHIPRKRYLLAGLGAVVTLASGGSAGPEGPIVQVGAGVGSEVGARAGAPSRLRRMLLGCGAAAGIATLFNAPIGGVLFVVEVITEGFGVLSMGPILISAVTATAIRHMVLGDAPPFGDLTDLPSLSASGVLVVTMLGVTCGFLGRLILMGWRGGHRFAAKLPGPTWIRPAFGGLVVGLCGLAAPMVMGSGYAQIGEIVSSPEALGIGTLLVIFLLKVLATGATLTTGGAGGVFAPSLFLGAVTGTFACALLSAVGIEYPPETFAIIGMAALMSSVLHCPMTALILVFELTRNYGLIVPTMAATVMATWISKHYEANSIFLLELAERGGHYRRGTDLSVLRQLAIVDLIETDAIAVRENDSFAEVLEAVKVSTRNYFPVLTADDALLGMIFLGDLRQNMFDPTVQQLVRARDLMHEDVIAIQLDDSMDSVMASFDSTGAWSLPVVFMGRFRGMISRSRIQVAYRNALIVETRV